jgi:kynurenine formamidase
MSKRAFAAAPRWSGGTEPSSARAAASSSAAARAQPPSVLRSAASLDRVVLPALEAGRLVDLTQPLGPETVLWPGSRPFSAELEADHDTGGAYSRHLSLPEHAGTHLDAPAHFSRAGATVDALPLDLLVRPLVRLDVRGLVGDDPAFTLAARDVEEIESVEGEIPSGCAVVVWTGWSRFLGRPEYSGRDGRLAFPGLGPDAARLLVERRAAGVGIDTLGIDPGHAVDAPAHRVTMPAGMWHLEGLVGLERVPARGAWLVAAVLPVVAGSGAPARAFAILPAA